MKKKKSKGKSPRARAVKDLSVSDARQVKGGVLDKRGVSQQKVILTWN